MAVMVRLLFVLAAVAQAARIYITPEHPWIKSFAIIYMLHLVMKVVLKLAGRHPPRLPAHPAVVRGLFVGLTYLYMLYMLYPTDIRHLLPISWFASFAGSLGMQSWSYPGTRHRLAQWANIVGYFGTMAFHGLMYDQELARLRRMQKFRPLFQLLFAPGPKVLNLEAAPTAVIQITSLACILGLVMLVVTLQRQNRPSNRMVVVFFLTTLTGYVGYNLDWFSVVLKILIRTRNVRARIPFFGIFKILLCVALASFF